MVEDAHGDEADDKKHAVILCASPGLRDSHPQTGSPRGIYIGIFEMGRMGGVIRHTVPQGVVQYLAAGGVAGVVRRAGPGQAEAGDGASHWRRCVC